MYLLFDCNNFFASCEQVFRPDWQGRPLIVLSNNDGCVVARSPAAKALGIAMGQPFFQIASLVKRENIVVCSANFALYADLSSRIMSILEDELDEIAQFSIDEAFAHVDSNDYASWTVFARYLRNKIRRWTSLIVSVGIAPTHTLAKLANEEAKHNVAHRGVLALPSQKEWFPLLKKTDISDVWGVGRKLTPRMKQLGIHTAYNLAQESPRRMRSLFGIHGEQMQMELNGLDVLKEIDTPTTRTQIMHSRSLKESIESKEELRRILCSFTEKAACKLRQEGLYCNMVGVVLSTSRFLQDTSRIYANGLTRATEIPTQDTMTLTRTAVRILDDLWREGFAYKKIGVQLLSLEDESQMQLSLSGNTQKNADLMKTLDDLNARGHRVTFCSSHGGMEKVTRSEHKTPGYTTNWGELPEAR